MFAIIIESWVLFYIKKKFFFFFAAKRGMWDLSSLTRVGTLASCIESAES